MTPTLTLETPVKLRLPKEWAGGQVYLEIADLLNYEDLGATHQWKTWKKALSNPRHWFALKYGRNALLDKVAELDEERFKSILFKDDKGLWTYSGMAPELLSRYGGKLEYGFIRPKYGLIPWAKVPPHELRWFQQKSLDLLAPDEVDLINPELNLVGHGAVELATGLGKSLIIVHLLKRIGLPGVVVAPTLSIASQLLSDLTEAFGTGRVGQFFDGRKQPGKMFVVAVSKSLMNLGPHDKAAELLGGKSVLIGDESHLLPAESLQKVILQLLGNIPYRYFLSGTQQRNDGADILLQGITGKIHLKMSVRQGIEQGFLSPLKFVQWSVRSDSNFYTDDSLKMNRIHLHDNPNVYSHSAKLIKRAVIEKGRKVLVLIDEVGQFASLVRAGMDLPVLFAHGGLNKENREDVPEAHWKSDPMDFVARFDRGEVPVLVGSSCIGMGTDVRSADFIVDLVGLASEVRVRQSVGRGTRLYPGKTGCIVNDYCVENIDVLRNQARKRAAIFDDIYGPVHHMR